METKFRIKESGFAIYGQGHGAILFGRGKEIYIAVNDGVPQREVTFSRPAGVRVVDADSARD